MSLPKPTLKSLEKMIMDIAGEMKLMRAEFGKSQKDLFNELRGLKEELTTQKNKVIVLEESVSFISDGYEKVKSENETMKNQIEILKVDNNKLAKKMLVLEENDKQTNIKLNQIENLMKGNNVEIQGVPAFENENMEMVAMKVLKKVDPRLERHHMGKIRRLRTIDAISNQEKKEGKRIFNPILVTFKSREQKVKIMKEKKKLYDADLSDIKAERVYINENLTKSSRNLLYLARRFKEEKGWKYAWSSSGTILLRKDEKSKVNVINSVEDIEKLQN